MRISDWSSDVCSSDLTAGFLVELVGVRRWNCCPADCVVPVGARARHGQCRCCWRWNGNLNSLCWRVVAATADGSSSRSEARSVGKECGSTCRSRGAHDHEKKKKQSLMKHRLRT